MKTGNFTMSDMETFFKRANQLLDRLDLQLAAKTSTGIDFEPGDARCWRYSVDTHRLVPVNRMSTIDLDDLKCIDRQKDLLITNTRQFIHGLPANNALLWGPRGTGKSSLIKALLNRYHAEGLRLIELQRDDLDKLSAICDRLYDQPGRYIIFCDDLSFEANEPGYKAIKVVLDGSVNPLPDNTLIYATSNRRHLVPENMQENLQSGMVDGELHLHEGIEEKLSLSERFGLWVAFHPFNQDQYLELVEYWLGKLMGKGLKLDEPARHAALKWALQHGSRSGRSALLFSRDWAGRTGLAGL
jgi:predicted AAA+ superfamily ATPase